MCVNHSFLLKWNQLSFSSLEFSLSPPTNRSFVLFIYSCLLSLVPRFFLCFLSLSLSFVPSLSLSFLSFLPSLMLRMFHFCLSFSLYILLIISSFSPLYVLPLSLSLSSNEQLYSLPLSLDSKSFSLPFSHLFLSPRSRSSLNILRLCFCNRFSLSFFLLCTSSIFLRFQSHGRSWERKNHAMNINMKTKSPTGDRSIRAYRSYRSIEAYR